MSQSRRMSLLESCANVAIGIGVAFVTQVVVFPWFGIHSTVGEHAAITGIFTAVSLARSYVVRRIFNGWRG